MLIHFMPFHMLFAHFLSIAGLLVSCLCLCMYTHGATHEARAWSLGCKQNGRQHKHGNQSQVAVVSRFRVQLFPLVMYSFKPLPSSSLSLLDGLYQVNHVVYHSSSSLEYGDPCLFSRTYILGHALGMQAFTFLLCVLALCMMYVHIYLLAPLRCDCHSPCHLRPAMPNFCSESKVTCCQIFAVEIWHLARTPQESINWDHTHSKAKPQSPMHAKPRKPMPRSFFYCQFLKIKVLSKDCPWIDIVGCLTPSPHVTKLPDLRIKIFCHPYQIRKNTFFLTYDW